MSDQADKRNVASATRTLALLNTQADELRAELVRLRWDLAEGQRDFGGTRAAHLREANERLVLAALQAETTAEKASSNLAKLTRSSQRDALTDTPNRALTIDRLDKAIAMARRRGTHVAVLFIDLDHFKRINDMLGHAVGDEVLQQVAHRLESAVRDSDTVSRHGGDEFLVLLPEVTQASDAALIAAKMLSAVAEPTHAGDHALHLSASIGITIYPGDGEDATTLISGADAAMYCCKRLGRGRFQFHAEEIPSDRSLEPSADDVQQETLARDAVALTADEHRLRDLREANEQLVIAAMTAQQLGAQAVEAYDRQIKFLAMVAHELRNPLSPILTAAEVLSRTRTDEPLLARLQVVIKRQGAHLSRLVEDLLDGSRVSTGKFQLERSAVEMGDILSLAVETCQPAMDARHQDLTVKLPEDPLRVHGDPVRLTQVFSNLLDNASKYTPEGGKITVAAEVLDHAMTITVSDNGIGITAEALPDIFNLFVQDTRALAFHNGGLGIGLAVVRELVEAHGGTVVGTSAGRDLGSEFVVTLPMIDIPITALTV